MDLPWISRHSTEIAASPEVTSNVPEPDRSVSETSTTLGLKETGDKSTSHIGEAEAKVELGVNTPQKVELIGRPRILQLRNFTQALKEITPSSSESLGSLAELRKWNDQFGEGRKDRKKRQVWGKGLFGFIDTPKDVPASELRSMGKE